MRIKCYKMFIISELLMIFLHPWYALKLKGLVKDYECLIIYMFDWFTVCTA